MPATIQQTVDRALLVIALKSCILYGKYLILGSASVEYKEGNSGYQTRLLAGSILYLRILSD